MTLGSAAAVHLQFMVWCTACGHRSEPDPAEQARWYGPETTVPDWGKRLVCSGCGNRNVSFVVSGTMSNLRLPHCEQTRGSPRRRHRRDQRVIGLGEPRSERRRTRLECSVT